MVQVSKNRDLSSHLYCPHDLSINYEFRDDLPTLIGTNDFNEDFNTTLKVIKDSSLGICKDMSKNLTVSIMFFFLSIIYSKFPYDFHFVST